MIVTDLSHATDEIAMLPHLHKAIRFLREECWKDHPDGRIYIDGDQVFSFIQSYETMALSPLKLQAHRRYIDIHFVASGEETIAWLPSDQLFPDEHYDEERDVWWGTLAASSDQVTHIKMHSGQMAVLFPSDGHISKQANGISSRVKKVLIKVAAQV